MVHRSQVDANTGARCEFRTVRTDGGMKRVGEGGQNSGFYERPLQCRLFTKFLD